MTPSKLSEMPDVIYAGKNEDGYVDVSEKVWDDYNTHCATKYIRADLAEANRAEVVDAIKLLMLAAEEDKARAVQNSNIKAMMLASGYISAFTCVLALLEKNRVGG